MDNPIQLYPEGGYFFENKIYTNLEDRNQKIYFSQSKGREGTIAYHILMSHNQSENAHKLKIKFDSLASHDITFVGIIQTARASGLEKFSLPYVLTNCHNSLCAVGGTINADDHDFGLSAAKRYGGIFVPPHVAVIHQYMREMMAGGGKMILGSDSHTRYGALGTIAIGEGGGELVKQLLSQTYDIDYPEIVGVYLKGKPRTGIGPHDVALSIVGAVFEKRFVKNRIMEFFGPGVDNLSVEFRNGIDVMTTETTCLSSIWKTDNRVKEYFNIHGRDKDFKTLSPENGAFYDRIIEVDLSKINCMIALPFHPSNVYSIEDLNENLMDILDETERKGAEILTGSDVTFSLKDKVKDGRLYCEQGEIAGCAGGIYDNLVEATEIIKGHSIGNDGFTLDVYPASLPVYQRLADIGVISDLINSGTIIKTAFCGPCFGGGDTPANNSLSVRHTTRNFINREGSKPSEGQIASVALMDARSIAATAINKGKITAATELEDLDLKVPKYYFNKGIYQNRVLNNFEKGDSNIDLRIGPNIIEWPEMSEYTEDIILQVAACLTDPVTTTDELIPSGDTSSYRSNPVRLSEFTLSRKDPDYVKYAKHTRLFDEKRKNKQYVLGDSSLLDQAYSQIKTIFPDFEPERTLIGSTITAIKPGDGSAREQAASCQKILGGYANIACEYATKRYRSNLINWGILPLKLLTPQNFVRGEFIYIKGIRDSIKNRKKLITGYLVNRDMKKIDFNIGELTDEEINILLSGCLINYNRCLKKKEANNGK